MNCDARNVIVLWPKINVSTNTIDAAAVTAATTAAVTKTFENCGKLCGSWNNAQNEYPTI